jgi:hypothetical protein
MMIYLAGLAFLTGWLVVELKDFMALDGVKNSLAFTLLKLSFIFVNLGLILARLFFPDILTRALEQMAQRANIASYDQLKNGSNSRSLSARHKRTYSE